MTPLSRLRELSARSTQIKELADKEKESPTVAPVTRGAIKGAATGAGLAGLAGAGLAGVGVLAASKANPRALLKTPAVGDIRTILKGAGVPANTPMLTGVAALGAGAKYAKTGAIVGGIGGAFQGARIKGRDEERFKNKEFGLLTKNEAAYDKDGHFTGIENHYNGPGIAEAAGGAALVGAGLGAGHVGLMRKYGTETLRREKGRFISPKVVQVPVGQAYKKAGSDVLAKIRSLAGKRFSAEDRLKELARGDYAIPAMKSILKASKEAPLHLNGVEGAAVPALRGNVHQVRRALNRFWGENSTAKEAALHTKGIRSWAAGEIRGERSLPKDLRAWAPAPSYKIKGNTLSAKDRLKELAAKSTTLKSFDQKLDENGYPIMGAAAGAGLGAGAVLGHQAVMRKYAPGASGFAGVKQAYGAAANDFKDGFSKGFNPPSTSAGSGSVATSAANSPLSADGAKIGGAAKAGEEASLLTRAGSKAGRLGSVIRGFLSRLR